MNIDETINRIHTGKTALGIELGSTRIKAVLIDESCMPIAAGNHEWENRLENGIWTYSLKDAWVGIQDAYQNLCADIRTRYGVELTSIGALGISGMMHGYLPFDKDGRQLAPFRTWRNTTTEKAAAKLTDLLHFNIPQRWSVAHLYQSILDHESHVGQIAHLTTLAGYVHWMLTGKKVLGVGEASGMFPIDSQTIDYDSRMVAKFDELVAPQNFGWKLRDLLPEVTPAGECAGFLTENGAKLLDVSGKLEPGTPLCPPEGDAGTGMTATNAVAKRTGNISAGTSIFAMVVLEKALRDVHMEIDMVTTPSGKPVAMVHCNNCTSDLDAWIGLLREAAETFGAKVSTNELYETLFSKALEGVPDCSGMLSYNYYAGEPINHLDEGRPLFMRQPDSKLNLENFMRCQLYACIATLKMGMNILAEEAVQIDRMCGHGGFFKTRQVGQSIMAAAINAPVTVMDNAGEGGSWGMALLANFMLHKQGQTLESYLDENVFVNIQGSTLEPRAEDVAGFEAFMRQYAACVEVERTATTIMRR
jgi:sugar (pentulose or hexulose) kinase